MLMQLTVPAVSKCHMAGSAMVTRWIRYFF